MEIRKSRMADLPEILKLYEEARAFMQETGNGTQWGTSYPPVEQVETDIREEKSYVCEEDGRLAGVFYFSEGPDPDYAEIYEGSKLIGTTDENGQLQVETNTLSLGTHRFTAVKKDEAGHNLLTAVMSSITVNKVSDPSADPNKTVVTFRLIGDTKHGEEGSDNEAVHAWLLFPWRLRQTV